MIRFDYNYFMEEAIGPEHGIAQKTWRACAIWPPRPSTGWRARRPRAGSGFSKYPMMTRSCAG